VATKPAHAACGGLGKAVLLQGMTGFRIHWVSSFPSSLGSHAAPHTRSAATATQSVYQRANTSVHLALAVNRSER
jgi:hypothetical protein